jgi:hypothetical protein
MSTFGWLRAASMALALVWAGATLLPQPAQAQRRGPPEVRTDPAVLASLKRMGDYVASVDRFEFKSAMSFDVVAGNGQTISVVGEGRYLAARPNKLRVDLNNSLFERSYFYDGRTFTVAASTDGYYGRTAARETIRDTLKMVARDFAIELPLADLFELGAPDSEFGRRIRSAFNVGEVVISGQTTEHLAFRTQDKDWELWIAKGDKPLPVKFVMINRADPAAPRFTANLTWSDSPATGDDQFSFSPGNNMNQIDFLHANAAKEAR